MAMKKVTATDVASVLKKATSAVLIVALGTVSIPFGCATRNVASFRLRRKPIDQRLTC